MLPDKLFGNENIRKWKVSYCATSNASRYGYIHSCPLYKQSSLVIPRWKGRFTYEQILRCGPVRSEIIDYGSCVVRLYIVLLLNLSVLRLRRRLSPWLLLLLVCRCHTSSVFMIPCRIRIPVSGVFGLTET